MANKNKTQKEDYPEISLDRFSDLCNSTIPSWDWMLQTPHIETGRMLVTLHFTVNIKDAKSGNGTGREMIFYIPSETRFDPEIKRTFRFTREECRILSDIADTIRDLFPAESERYKMSVMLKEQLK